MSKSQNCIKNRNFSALRSLSTSPFRECDKNDNVNGRFLAGGVVQSDKSIGNLPVLSYNN